MSTQSLKRLISMMLVCVMVFSMLPMGALAEAMTDEAEVVEEVATPEPTEEPTPEPTKEPTPEPTKEPTKEPTPEPTKEPTPEPTKEPTPEPTEEPTPEPTEEPSAEDKLAEKVDAMLLKYLGDEFDDEEKTKAEILDEVNGMSDSEIEEVVAQMSASRFKDLCGDIRDMRDAAEKLDATSVLKRGVFGELSNAAQARKDDEEAKKAEELTTEPTVDPTVEPSEEPTVDPTVEPSEEPTVEPTVEPSEEPTVDPTVEPSEEPTVDPTVEPSEEPTVEPTVEPSEEPTVDPTVEPSEEPSVEPTVEPSEEPTTEPTEEPVVEELTVDAQNMTDLVVVGESEISITVKISGGVAPYTVAVNDGDAQTTENTEVTVYYAPAAWGEGSVTVTVTDAENATASAEVSYLAAESEHEHVSDWENSVKDAKLTGIWAEDIIAVAKTQLGEGESEKDFVLDENGDKHFYTRYGAWYGSAYGDWCAMFIAFCANYANIPHDYYPTHANVDTLAEKMQAAGAYMTDDAYAPQAGDIVFFGDAQDIVHVGLVEYVEGDMIHTIEGNKTHKVERFEYAADDETIAAYASIDALMQAYWAENPDAVVGAEGETDGELTEITYPCQGVTTKPSVNVRTGTSTETKLVVQIAEQGTEVTVTGEENVDGVIWYAVTIGEDTGYIRGDLLELIQNEEIEEPAISEEMVAAIAALTVMTEKYSAEYTEETYEAVLAEKAAGMDEAVLALYAEEYTALEAAMALLTEEELAAFQVENADALSWMAALKEKAEALAAELAAQAVVDTVRAQLDALSIPEYTAETLWTAMDELIAAKQAEEVLEAYQAEIAAAQEALAALTEEQKAALETEYAAQLSFMKLLPVKVTFDALVASYYVDFEDELWILFETKLALMDMDALVAAYNDITNAMTVVYALPEAELVLFSGKYAVELDFMMQFYAAINEKAATPMTLASTSSKFDASVTNGYYNILSEKDYNIISGVTETEIVMNNSDGTRRQLFRFFSIDPTSSSIELVPGYNMIDKYANDPTNTAYQTAAKVTDMAAYYESNLGYDIVGGMNTALAYDSNAPYSFLMWEGKVLQDKNDSFGLGYDWLNQHTGKCATYIAIKKDGSVELRDGETPFEEDDWNCVGANFGWLVKDGKFSKSESRSGGEASRSMIGIKADGTLIFCQTDGRGANNSVGQTDYEMSEMMLALGCVNAFNCDGGGSSTFISQRAGESNLTMRSTPSDGSERPTIHAIFIAKAKGMTPGIFDYAEINSEYDYFVPETTYTFTAEAIDTTGAAMEMPEGGEWSLSDDDFGTITDGTFVSNGTLGEVAVQYTVGGKTAEYTINVVHPDSFGFGADSTVIPYGKSVVLAPAVLYGADNWDVYYQPDSFDWTFSDETAGIWDENTMTYTASVDETKTGTTLTVRYKYSIELPVATYKIEFGKGSEILGGWDFENGDVSDWMGFSDAKAWSENNGVNNSLLSSTPLAGQFSEECDAHTFLASADNGQVKNGKYALGVTFDNSNSAFAEWTYNVLFNVGEERVFRDTANGLNATTLGFWLYIPEGGTGLAFQAQLWDGTNHFQDHFTFLTVDGTRKNLNSCTEADIPANRWVYASINLSGHDYVSTLDSEASAACKGNDDCKAAEYCTRAPSFLRTYIKPTAPAQLTFYIDDITLDYSAAVEDRNAPVISGASYATADESVALTDGAVIASNSIAFTANIAENTTGGGEISGLNLASAKIYIDGNEVETEASKTTMATKNNVELADGQHRVTFEIEDNWYNRTQLSYEFTVEGEKAALVELSGHNDSGSTPDTGSVYYVDINTTAAEDVAMLEATIQLNTANAWELEHMIVAPGFEVEWMRLDDDRYTVVTFADTTDIHGVENTVAVTLYRTDDCALIGEQTLLSIPVRVWSWTGVNGVTGAEVDYPKNKPLVNIDYTILSGYVENNDGNVIEFGGSKSVATTMTGQTSDKVYHEHEAVPMEDEAATCTEAGYTGRTYCEGCGSVVEWGETVEAGHICSIVNKRHICDICGEDLNKTGLYTMNGKAYYAIGGNLISGWQTIDGEAYYFDAATFEGYNGSYALSSFGITTKEASYTFEDGRLVSGVWVEYDGNWRYFYGQSYYTGWKTIGADEYYFDNQGYRYEGYQIVVPNPNYPSNRELYQFADDGKLITRVNESGVYFYDDEIVYLDNGWLVHAGLVKYEDSYYYFKTDGAAVKDITRYVAADCIHESAAADGFTAGTYTFGSDGKMVIKNGLIDDYYYINGVLQKTGLTVIDGDIYYFSTTNGEMNVNKTRYVAVDCIHESAAAIGLKDGYYTFGADGKAVIETVNPTPAPTPTPKPEEVKNGIVGDYYYIDNVIQKTGLTVIDGDVYYFSTTNGTMNRDKTRWVAYDCIDESAAAIGLKDGYYTFGADGKAVIETVNPTPTPTPTPKPEEVKNGIIGDYYYIDNVIQKTGLTVIDGDVYYFSTTNGVMNRDKTRWVAYDCIHESAAAIGLKDGYYTFGADGKAVIESATPTPAPTATPKPEEVKNGIIGDYYYIDNVIQKTGLTVIDGDVYYFSTTNGVMNRDKTRWVAYDCIDESAAAIGLKDGYYTFGADGKAVIETVNPTPTPTPTPKPEEVKNGIIGDYYYIDNVIQKTGLTVIDGDVYYFSTTNGVMNRDKTRWVAYDCIDESAAAIGLKDGYYTFGADGKAVQ